MSVQESPASPYDQAMSTYRLPGGERGRHMAACVLNIMREHKPNNTVKTFNLWQPDDAMAHDVFMSELGLGPHDPEDPGTMYDAYGYEMIRPDVVPPVEGILFRQYMDGPYGRVVVYMAGKE